MDIFKRFRSNRESKKISIDPFGNVSARWYTLKDNEGYAKAFHEVPELNSIITNKAQQLAKGIWMCKNLKTDEPIENDAFLKVLNNPNPLMGGAEWLQALSIDYDIYGNAYNYFNTPNQNPTPDNVKQIYNLPARYTYPKTTGKLFNQTRIEDIISEYRLHIQGTDKPFDTKRVCHVSNSGVDILNGQYVVGESKLKSLNWALSNIKAAYEARNVYITRRGAFGILSNNQKGDFGFQAIDKKDELQDEINKYGLTKDKWQILVTNAALSWQAISVSVKDLELYKEVKESVIAIAMAYNYPTIMLGYMEGSTFANQEGQEKKLFTHAVIPFSKQISGEINRTVNAQDYNKEYYLSYDHIDSIQKDKKVEAQRREIEVRTIVQLQKSIQEGNTNYETGVNILVSLIGIKEDVAKDILNERNENATQENQQEGT